MLMGLGGLYGAAATLGVSPSSLAEPSVLDLNAACERTTGTKETPEGLNCCPPYIDPAKVVDFDPQNYPNPAGLRVRPAAHKVDAQYLAKFQEAMRRMKALPPNDPRSFLQQANVHCAYCNGGYHQLHNTDKLLQVHYSWLFFPFHRAYLYFFERILGKLIDDPTFAIPFWNWDHPDGMRMPTIYTDGGPHNPLFNPNRDGDHQPPKVMDLAFGSKDSGTPDETQIYYNLWHMYIQVVRPRKPELFMGGKYVAGDDTPALSGSLEFLPHNNIHSWTGDRKKRFNIDMGSFFSAGRDPIFYGLHANVDRMWYLWKNLDGGRSNFDDPDWLNAYFVFYDENKQPVRIYVRDCLNINDLGYSYEDIELPWLEPMKPVADGKPLAVPKTPAQKLKLPRPLGDLGFRTKVSRPKKGRSKKEKKNLEEVLVVELELGPSEEFVKFDVLLNDENDSSSDIGTKASIAFAGSFSSLPEPSGKGHNHGGRKIKLQLPITEVIEDIGADNDDSVDVVFVAQSGQKAVTIRDVKIKYV